MKIKDLLQRYLEMKNEGLEVYFDADEIVELLDHFEDTNNLDHYEKVLNLGRKLHPESMDIKIRACKIHIYREQYGKALKLIEQIGEAENQDLNLLKMECFCALDRYGEVIRFIETQQRLPDEELEVFFEYLAPVLNELDRPEQSYDFIMRGLALFPDNVILKEEFCYYLETQGQTQQALQLCNELIDTDPYSVDYWYMQGRLYFDVEKYDQAVEAFDFALACDDSSVEIQMMKACCLFMSGNYEKAIEVYLDLLSEENDLKEQIQPFFVECYMKSDDFEQACSLFRELFRNIDLRTLLGNSSHPLSDIQSIIALIDREIGKDCVHIHSAMKYLAVGDIKSFCRQYAQCRPGIISEYLNQVLSIVLQNRFNQIWETRFLLSDEIDPGKETAIASDQLSSDYLTNQYHPN